MRFLPERIRDIGIPLAVFVLAYAGYAVVELSTDSGDNLLTGLLLVGFIGGMMLAIIWYAKREDEVRRAIMNKAYSFAFWVTFLFLYVAVSFRGFEESVRSMLPLWTVPVLAWLAGYLINTIRYR